MVYEVRSRMTSNSNVHWLTVKPLHFILAQFGNFIIVTACPLNLVEHNTVKIPSLCSRKEVIKADKLYRFSNVFINY